MKRGLGVAVFGVCLLGAPAALADAITATPEASDPTLRPVVHERRAGIVFGGTFGAGFAGASGYPNGARFLNDPSYYSASPLLVGWSASGFVMGALTDYLNLGPVLSVAEFDSAKWKSTGFGIGFRGELFPFVKVWPRLADLAAYGQLGFGETELRAKGPYPTADGSSSYFSGGIHYEWSFARFLGAHTTAGPFVEYSAIRSESAERHWLSIGFRIALYSRDH